jgi:hypothetical protein
MVELSETDNRLEATQYSNGQILRSADVQDVF